MAEAKKGRQRKNSSSRARGGQKPPPRSRAKTEGRKKSVPDPTPERTLGQAIPERLLNPEGDQDREDRAALMFRMRSAGVAWTRIGQSFGVDESTVREVVRAYRKRHRSDLWSSDAAREWVEEQLEGYENTLEHCAGLIAGGQPSNRVAAMRLRNDTYRERLALLMELGVVPRDLGQFLVQLDVMDAAHRIVEVLEEHGVPEEVQQAVIEAVAPPDRDQIEAPAEEEEEVVDAEVVPG